jgi:hypothetical protein
VCISCTAPIIVPDTQNTSNFSTDVISACASALLASSPTRNKNKNEWVGDERSDRSGNEGQMFRQPASAEGYVRPAGDYTGQYPSLAARCCPLSAAGRIGDRKSGAL